MSKDQAEERKRIAARIRALLSKTVENGCTEQEAVAAASMAAEWLARHDMELDEVSLRASVYSQEQMEFEEDVGDRLGGPAQAIAKLTKSRYWRTAKGVYPVTFKFLGLTHEVEIATYLLGICARAMRDGSAALDIGLYRPDAQRRKRAAFLDGMSNSLYRRIMALCPVTPPGKGIVVLRDALLDEEMARRGIETREMRSRLVRDFEDTYDEGLAAGERLRLDPALKPGAKPAGRLTSR